MSKAIKFIVLTLLFLLILLHDPLTSYFSQDDFFHLRSVYQRNISDIPSFFMGVSNEYGFFRPLARETYNLLMFKSFGLNPFPFHLVNLIIVEANSFLTYFLIRFITKSRAISYLTSAFYLTSSIHAVELYYLGSVQQLLATTFLSISVLFFLKYLRKKGLNNYLISFLAYLLALFCHELAIVASGILFMVYFSHFHGKKSSFPRLILMLVPFAIFSLLHFQFILGTSLPSQQAYIPTLNLKSMVNNLGWYALWSLGLPESLVDFVGPGLKINTDFLKWFGNYSVIVFSSFGLMMFSLFLGFALQKGKNTVNRSTFLFISLFVISLSPFLFFPQHKFVYYLSFAIIWFNAALSSILSNLINSTRIVQILAILIIFSYLLISYQTINFYGTTYWAAKRANAAKVILDELKQDLPNVKANTVFYILDDPSYPDIGSEWGTSSKQAFYILSGSDALKLLYKDSSVETYYQALGGFPEGIDEKKVISFTAKFPY